MQRNNSSQIASLISPVHGCRDALRRKGIEPEDYHKKNLAFLKSLKLSSKPPGPEKARPKSSSLSDNHYILQNISYVKSLKVPCPEVSEPSVADNIGIVPKYLSTIQKTLEDNRKSEEFEASKKLWPKGTRLLTDEEAHERMEALNTQKKALIEGLSKLPFTSDTNATKARRSQFEFKLKEIEFQISRLSLPKVFVQV